MKTRSLKIARFVALGLLLAWALAPKEASAAQPSLGVRLIVGQPMLSLTGVVGTVYSIQYATGLSRTNLWVDRTLVRAEAGGTVWSDPSAPATGQRFYRAVSVPVPADTNLVFIQAGTFTMGGSTNEVALDSNEMPHSVIISRGFWIGKNLVTQAEYLDVIGSNPSYFRNGQSGTNSGGIGGTITNELRHPVEQISWNDATNYCARLTGRERTAGRLAVGWRYRLPTEAEWEYACRAGTTTAFYLGNGLRSGQANFNGRYEWDNVPGGYISNPSGIFLGITSPVGTYAANPWGLYDMIGNVSEWCQDWWNETYPAGTAVDPQGPDTGSLRVTRGGELTARAVYCRSAFRNDRGPCCGSPWIGFRVLLVPN